MRHHYSFRLSAGALALVLSTLVGCKETRIPGPAPTNSIAKDSLYGEWYVQSTVTETGLTTPSPFPGLQGTVVVVRWEVQEHYLVAYESYEVVLGRDDAATTPIDGEPTRPSARELTGELAPGTRCFDASSNLELPCEANPAEGVRVGFAGHDGVVCRDPEGHDVDCYPFKGDPVVMYAIEHVDTAVEEETIVEDSSSAWSDKRYIRVDWSQNLVDDAINLAFSGTLYSDPRISASYVEEGMPGEDAFRREADSSGRLAAMHVTSRIVTAAEAYLYGAMPFTQEVPSCILQGNEEYSCGASEFRYRTTFRRAPESSEYESYSHDAFEAARFPLYGAKVRRYDPYRGELLSESEMRPWRFDLWKESFRKSSDGSYARDASGGRVPIPPSERELREVRYWMSGDWPESSIDDVERVMAEYDAVLREAVSFKTGRPIAEVPSIVKLSFNGRQKLLDANVAESGCASLVASGAATKTSTTDGKSACAVVDFDPQRDRAIPPEAVLGYADFDEGRVAELGDLTHHLVHWHSEINGIYVGLHGYGPSSVDPRTGEVLQAVANIYGGAIDQSATEMVDRINAMNGFLTEEQITTGANVRDEVLRRRRDAMLSGSLTPDRRSAPLADSIAAILGTDANARVGAIRAVGLSSVAHDDSGTAALTKALGSHPEVAAAFENLGGAEGGAFAPLSDGRFSTPEWVTSASERRIPVDASGVSPCLGAPIGDEVLARLAKKYQGNPIDIGSQEWAELRDLRAAAVLGHELGHNFGLQHNFQGSHDALNFEDAYWQIRRENLRPASEIETVADFLDMSEPTEAQLDAGLEEYALASQMEYVAVRTTTNLRRFDRAALMYSFGGAAEVFDWDPVLVAPETRTMLREAASRKSASEPTFTQRVHYSQIPFLLGSGSVDDGLSRLSQRRFVNWSELRRELEADEVSDATPLLVPYEACNDAWHAEARNCLRWDRGADDYETTRAAVSEEALDYFFDYFRRDRAFFYPFHVYFRLLNMIAPVQNVFAHGFAAVSEGSRDPLTETAWAAATEVGFRFAVRLATTPDYGSFAYEPTYDYYYLIDPKLGQSDLDVPVGTGRRGFDLISDTGSLIGNSQTEEVGHAWGRLVALSLMAHREPYFAYRDSTVHDRLYVSYDLLFPDALDRLFGNIFLGAQGIFMPRADEAGNIAFADPRSDLLPPGSPILMTLADETRRTALTYAYAFLRDRETLRFAEREGHVFLMGTTEEVLPSAGYQVVTFTDPTTGLTYGTLDSKSEPGRGTAAQYVLYAKSLADVYWSLPPDDPQRFNYGFYITAVTKDLDFMRTLYAEFANVELTP